MKTILAWGAVALALLLGLFLFLRAPPSKTMGHMNLGRKEKPFPGTLKKEPDQSPPLRRKFLPNDGTENRNFLDIYYRQSLSGLRGRILWETSKRPVPGILIEAFELGTGFTSLSLDGSFPELLGSLEPKSRSITNEAGSFHLKGLERNEFLGLLIGAGTKNRAFRFVGQTIGPGETKTIPDIFLHERGSLKGVVLGQDHDPLEGAKVYAWDIPRIIFDFGLSSYDPEGLIIHQSPFQVFVGSIHPSLKKIEKKLPFGITTTKKDGTFFIQGLRKGPTSILIVAPGFARKIQTTSIRPGTTRDLGSITLKKGGNLEGHILDPLGKPIPKVQISVAPKSPTQFSFGVKPKRSNSEGKFQFEGLGRGRYFVLTKISNDLPWSLHGPFHLGDFIEIQSSKLLQKKVMIRSTSGEVISNVDLFLRVEGGMRFPKELFDSGLKSRLHVRKSEKSGEWILHDLPEGRYWLRIHAKGFLPSVRQIHLKEKNSKLPLTIRLQPGISLNILVQDRAGRPLPSARVYFKNSQYRRILLGRTGPDGRLRVTTIPPQPGTFIARHPHYALGSSKVRLPQNGGTYPVVLPYPCQIQGQIINAKSLGLKTYTLFAEPSKDLRMRFEGLVLLKFTVSNLDGSFTFKALQPGAYRVMPFVDVSKLSSIPEAITLGQKSNMTLPRVRGHALVPEGGVGRITLDFGSKNRGRGTGRINGIVHEGGTPSSGKALSLWGSTHRRTISGANGTYQFTQLPKGKFEIVVLDIEKDSGAETLSRTSISLGEGEQKTHNFEISRGTLEIKLLDPQGHPLDHSKVLLQRKGKPKSGIVAFTDDQGWLRRKVTYGRWRVSLSWSERKKTGWSLPPKNIDVHSSKPVRLRLQAINDIPFRGTISLDLSRIHPDWLEEVRKNLPRQANFLGRNSSWTVPLKPEGYPSPLDRSKHPPGSFRVSAFQEGEQWKTTIEVTKDNHLNLKVVLSPPELFTNPKPFKRKKKKKMGK
jgi:hypothetical protein